MQHPAVPAATEVVGRSAIDAGLRVHSALGAGLLESAYEQGLAYELARRGVEVCRQVILQISYENTTLVAGYRIYLLVGRAVIIEVKSVETLTPVHRAQLVTYLKLSGHRLGSLMNFNVRLFKDGPKRMVI
ncbi:MAG TPA: GxxExxY protein [Rhizomicrobium sp.]|jgi:GxxExxY protein|nr:GxxExxY protein [Rhizomicrobium sp.]